MSKYNILLTLNNIQKVIDNSNIQKKYFKSLEYYKYLKNIQNKLNPKTYLEIGVRNGASIVLAPKSATCYGVDPVPAIRVNLSKKTKIYPQTSDDFFKQNENLPTFDLAFIDGMHLFDFVLRDFINTEKHCHKNSTIVLHDTVPKDEITARRNRCTDFWTGDVYKIILILKKYRPDLEVHNLDIKPSGLAIVKNLNPESTTLSDNYDKIIEEYINMAYEENIKEKLFIKPSSDFEKIF